MQLTILCWAASSKTGKLCRKIVPYLGLHNAQDFPQILYFVGGV
jgi:hypothetical protein